MFNRIIKLLTLSATLALLVIGTAQSLSIQASPSSDFAELFKIVKPGVVKVMAFDSDGALAGEGSGFIIRDGRDLKAITAFHIIQPALEKGTEGTWKQVNRIEVLLPDPKNNFEVGALDANGSLVPHLAPRSASLVRGEEEVDIAQLDIGPVGREVWWGNSDRVEAGQTIFTVGYSQHFGSPSISWGVVTDTPNGAVFLYDASTSPGMSGGPIFDMRGQVIGMVAELSSRSGISLVTNGSFETQNFSGWTVEDRGRGQWRIDSEDPTPTDGDFQASAVQRGPGSNILYQDIALPARGSCELSFDLAVSNAASDFVNGGSLDYTGAANQQVRVDLISPPADDPFVFDGPNMTHLFTTEPGTETGTFEYRPFQFDLGPFAGETVRLRFAEVDNQSFLFVSVDNVALTCQVPPRVISDPGTGEVIGSVPVKAAQPFKQGLSSKAVQAVLAGR